MNIQISQINNGFVVALQMPQGQTATYVPDFNGVMEELKGVAEIVKNQPKPIIPGSPEDR